MEKTVETRKPSKVVVRKLERLETTAVIVVDPGCRNEVCG